MFRTKQYRALMADILNARKALLEDDVCSVDTCLVGILPEAKCAREISQLQTVAGCKKEALKVLGLGTETKGQSRK